MKYREFTSFVFYDWHLQYNTWSASGISLQGAGDSTVSGEASGSVSEWIQEKKIVEKGCVNYMIVEHS